MPLDPQLKRQLRQTVYVAAVSSVRDARGQPSYAAAVSRLARWEPKRKLVRNANGEEVVTEFWMVCVAAVKLLDRVWGPDDGAGTDATKARKPIAVQELVDERGRTTHYEVWL